MLTVQRTSRGATAAFVAAISGVVALASIVLFLAVGQPFGTINDLALLVMTASLPPVMLAHYQLGGPVPLWPARLSLGGAMLAVAAWLAIQAAMIVGLISFDYAHGARDWFLGECIAQAVIGLWIAGASLLAGRWLPLGVRILGVIAGLGTVLLAVGLASSGANDVLAYVGGLGYQIGLPVWAFFLGRVFQARAVAAVGGAAPVEAGAADPT